MSQGRPPPPGDPVIVGRDDELRQLRDFVDRLRIEGEALLSGDQSRAQSARAVMGRMKGSVFRPVIQGVAGVGDPGKRHHRTTSTAGLDTREHGRRVFITVTMKLCTASVSGGEAK
jgi:hypothetical protein